jgi:regulator of protease activity HflC (stomatin/prohibitin superfamily)
LSFFSYFQVEEGHCASVSSFGKAKRNADGTLQLSGPGMHSKLPWEKSHVLSLMEKKIDLSTDDHPFQTMARDGTTLSVQASVRLRARQDHAEMLLYAIENPMDHIRDYLSCVLRSEIANFGENMEPGDVFIQLRNQQPVLRAAFESAVKKTLEEGYGVELLGLDLVDLIPPQELANAMNSVQTARADSESMIARANALREKKLYSANKRLEVSKKEAMAAELEMVTVGLNLITLQKNGTLAEYVSRRKDEVYKLSRLSIVKQEEK